MLERLIKPLTQDLAIDLGTSTMLAHSRHHGVIMNEPSVIALSRRGGQTQVLAVGTEAARMVGRAPDTIETIRPVRTGVIADFAAAEVMIRRLFQQASRRRRLAVPRVILVVPSGATQVERRALREVAESAGAREVILIDEALAAAIGAGLPVTEATGSMVVDIGGGTTEIAVLALGGVVLSRSLPIGGFVMDQAIAAAVRRTHNLLIGEVTAEAVKHMIGSAVAPSEGERQVEVSGRDLMTGVPRRAVVGERELAESLSESLVAIIDNITIALEETPPELAADIVDKGIVLTGGGALLHRLDALLRYATGLPVIVAEDPLTCAVRGAALALENAKSFPTALQH